MPRVYVPLSTDRRRCEVLGDFAIDVCRRCWPPQTEDIDAVVAAPAECIEMAACEAEHGGGAEHPPYQDGNYHCRVCHKELGEEDN